MNKQEHTSLKIEKLMDVMVEVLEEFNNRLTETEKKVDDHIGRQMIAGAKEIAVKGTIGEAIKKPAEDNNTYKLVDFPKVGIKHDYNLEDLKKALKDAAPKAIEFGIDKDFVAKTHKFESIIPSKSKNQKRKELIQFAKDTIKEIEAESNKRGYSLSYHTNPKENTVEATISILNEYKVKQKASCNPEQVFNLYILKAIALSKAWYGKVDDRLNDPVQPEKVVEGMKIKFDDYTGSESHLVIHKKVTYTKSMPCVTLDYFNNNPEDTYRIVDDSNAKY